MYSTNEPRTGANYGSRSPYSPLMISSASLTAVSLALFDACTFDLRGGFAKG